MQTSSVVRATRRGLVRSIQMNVSQYELQTTNWQQISPPVHTARHANNKQSIIHLYTSAFSSMRSHLSTCSGTQASKQARHIILAPTQEVFQSQLNLEG
jgi:hypothetical protein